MAGYLGASPVPQTIQKKQSFTATASQTTFTTTGYTDGAFINVYLNGVRLINGTDYTATNGSDIVLTTGASASDVLDFETFNEFTLVDQTLETPTFRTSATLKNDTEEDTDGGRESTIIFKGEQSGGEISTLAEIEASHDGTADDEKGDLIFRTNDGSDGSSPTEAMRIDSSQNLLVGKTSQGSATAGGEILASGTVIGTRDGSTAGRFNRKTSDGGIVDFRKDNTVVGSIGSISGVVSSIVLDPRSSLKGAGIAGASIDASNGVINPTDKTGATSDGNINLGSTGARWQNLFLSGGAYIGGTVAANKLDDYEEGTWSPKWVNTSDQDIFDTAPTINMARYTKIGDTVTASAYFNNPGSSFGTTANYSASSAVNIGGLPFTSNRSGSSDFYGGTVGWYDNWSGYTGGTPMCYSANNSSRVALVFQDNADVATVKQQDVDNTGSGIIFTVTYKTSS